MKKLSSILTIIVLSASIALADGHTGSGGRCETNCTPPPCTTNCGGNGLAPADDEGIVSETGNTTNEEEFSMVDYLSEIFFELIG